MASGGPCHKLSNVSEMTSKCVISNMNTENYHTFLAGQMTILTQKNEKTKTP